MPRFLILAIILAITLASKSAEAAPALDTPTTAPKAPKLEPCHLHGLTEEVLCTTLDVYEDRVAQSGRKITLRIAVMPAQSRRRAADPIFILSGGPGQAATEMAGLADRIFDDVRKRRDVVFVDLRGTGGSNPLSCPQDEPAALGEEAASAAECHQSLASRGDTRFYTAGLAMDDVDDVRRALGYERVNL